MSFHRIKPPPMLARAPIHYHPDFSVDAAPQAVNFTAARPSRNTHILNIQREQRRK
jgi:hypothetical protein